jgi:hypothetical protein
VCPIHALHWFLMAWSRRRSRFVLILAVLGLVAFAAIWLQPVSPLRNAYNQIRVGMNGEQVGKVLEGRTSRIFGAFAAGGYIGLTHQGADGETLTICWDAGGHIVGKEYHSGIEMKLRSLWDRLRGMLHW